MADQLTEEQIKYFKESVDIFDKDGDGIIDLSELGTVMKSLGQNPTEEDMKNMIKNVDTNNSGTIDFEEFLKMMAQYLEGIMTEDEALKDAFKVFDGYITHDELKQVMNKMGENLTDADVDDMIKKVDDDEDGKINYKEFVKMVEGQ